MVKLDDIVKRGQTKIRSSELIEEAKQAYDKVAGAERTDAQRKEIAAQRVVESKPRGLLYRYKAGELPEGEAAAMHKAVAICKGMLALFNYPDQVIPREAVYEAFVDICQCLDIRCLEELLLPTLYTTTQSKYYPEVQRLFHIVDEWEATPEEPTPEQDEEDIISCAHIYLKLVRCKKCRRYINSGYICIHCDNANG